MRKMRMATVLAVLTLAATVVQADLIAPPKDPPTEKTLTGKLTWKMITCVDGTEQKVCLRLTTADGSEVNLLPAREVKNTPEYEKLVGKEVVATVVVRENADAQGKSIRWVTKAKDIKEAPPAKP